MAYQAPILEFPVSTTDYQAQIDSNFEKIDTALRQLENEITAALPADGAGNMAWLDDALNEDGIVGRESFQFTFPTNRTTISITEREGGSIATIDGRRHVFSATFTRTITSFAQFELTPVRVAVGLHSMGTSLTEIVCEPSVDESTDAELGIDLLLYDFFYQKVTIVGVPHYKVQAFRRRCPVLMDGTSFDQLYQEIPIVFTRSADLPATGSPIELAAGFVAPWAFEVSQVSARFTAAPSGGNVEIDLRGEDPEASIISGGFLSWTPSDDAGEVKTLVNPDEDKVQVEAGEWVRVGLRTCPAFTSGPLHVTVLVRRLLHAVYRDI